TKQLAAGASQQILVPETAPPLGHHVSFPLPAPNRPNIGGSVTQSRENAKMPSAILLLHGAPLLTVFAF
ncbi:hypothetical protein, partial [Escherichia coli]|uniref:hypothetical protein n=1 Tax=Escherichia coli TaxID=562 RepID=UPI00195418B8